MTSTQIIVLATPVFLLLMALELWMAARRKQSVYRLADATSSIVLGMMSQWVAAIGGALSLAIYTGVWAGANQWLDLGKWWSLSSPLAWLLALLIYDLCYYWHHRAGHRVAVLWAAHAVHHQSEDYNLSTALRQTGSGGLLGWIFYVPMAVAGVPPLMFAVVALVDLLYQYWVHTELIDDLGWFDRWFCSPSNHRVHHAVNPRYLDCNYGGILLVWDRIWGTWVPEDRSEPPVYGTQTPLHSWNPVTANVQVYRALWQKSQQALNAWQAWQVWWRPPGWKPPGPQVVLWPDTYAGLPEVGTPSWVAPTRWDPGYPFWARCWNVVGFVLLLAWSVYFLWNAHLWSAWEQLGMAAAFAAAAALVFGVMDRVAKNASPRPQTSRH